MALLFRNHTQEKRCKNRFWLERNCARKNFGESKIANKPRKFGFGVDERDEEMTIGKVDGVRGRKSKKENVTVTCRKLNGKCLQM